MGWVLLFSLAMAQEFSDWKAEKNGTYSRRVGRILEIGWSDKDYPKYKNDVAGLILPGLNYRPPIIFDCNRPKPFTCKAGFEIISWEENTAPRFEPLPIVTPRIITHEEFNCFGTVTDVELTETVTAYYVEFKTGTITACEGEIKIRRTPKGILLAHWKDEKAATLKYRSNQSLTIRVDKIK